MGENAARIAWSGVGIRLPRRLVTARAIRLATRRVLTDPAFAERAQRLHDWSARNDGAAVAADALEEFAASSPQRT